MFRKWLIIIVLCLARITAMGQGACVSPLEDTLRRIIGISADEKQTLHNIQQLISRTEDVEEKYFYSKAFLDRSLDFGNDSILMHAYLYAGYSAHLTGKPLEALDFTYKSLMIADSLQYHKVITNCYLNLGCFYAQLDLEECLKYYNLGIQEAERHNFYNDLEPLYYNVAIFYLERKVYNLAVEYFEKARQAYLKTGKTSQAATAEYDFTIGLNRLLYHIQMRDTARSVQMLDSMNAGIATVRSLETMEGLANVSMGLCECNLMVLENNFCGDKANYLLFAEQYLDILGDLIERYNIQWLIPEAYNTVYARFLLLMGKKSDVAALLADEENFSQATDFCYVKYLYSKSVGRYRDALEFLNTFMRMQNGTRSVQSAANYADQQELMEYDRKMEAMRKESALRNSAYQLQQNRNAIAKYFVIALLLIMLVIIFQFLYSHHNSNIVREKLTRTHAELSQRNAMLNNLHEEILSQTDEIQSQKLIIENQRDTLAEANHLLNYSINVGRDIQRALIWDEYQLKGMLGDSFVFWKPLHVVSGDFYWFTEIGDRKFVLVADCTGHGVPGALLSMYGIAMMNDYVKRNSHLGASEILELIKEAYIAQFVRGDSDFYDGMDCALMILNRSEMTVEYSGARRPLIQIHDGEVIHHRPDRISIGINPMREHCRFSNHVIPVHQGDMIYAFSDGISDQFGDEDGTTKFGTQQLLDILQEVSFLDTSIQKTIIESVVVNWRTGAYYAGLSRTSVPQLDDQLLIGVRV